MRRRRFGAVFILAASVSSSPSSPALAQERPYFVTYDHYLEEAGNLELEYASTLGSQRGGHGFHALWLEFDYGATGWWTTELYLDGQTTFSDGTLFTGFRWENRFRPLAHEHFLNPVVYVEYEQLNGADKILKEVEGHDVESDYGDPNALLRQDRKHELELKLLLSKSIGGWNIAVNPLAGKNLSAGNPWEFGYALGVSRPLALEASPTRCSFCRENFIIGLELYGGLGDTQLAGLPATSHYLAPAAAWTLPSGWAVRGSVGFGLNQNSHPVLVRWSVSREVSDFGGMVSRLFGGRGEDRQGGTTDGVHHQHEGHDHYAELAKVPASASVERNPLHQDSTTVAAGGKLFDQHCAECHGAAGHGTRRGPSLKQERLRQATPGALYWILSNGVVRHGMPDWSKLPERERWQIVTFLTSHEE
ncbi:MAG TPA: cytochrome c [Gemmatimonadales bacterium]|nr:cytochrome c [Gemmatimonadales bacterium]